MHPSFVQSEAEHAEIYIPQTRYGGILLAVELSQRRQIGHLHRSGRSAFVLRNHLQGILSGGLYKTKHKRTQRSRAELRMDQGVKHTRGVHEE